MTKLTSVCALALAAVIPVLQAQDEAPAPASASPLYEGAYLAPMASYVITDAERVDDGYGGVLAAGYRFGSYALEFSGIYSSLSAEGGEDVRETGGSLGGLLFPLDSLPNLFLIGQGGAIEIKHYPMSPKSKTFGVTTFAGGLGHLFDFSIGNYEFALRAEALYRYAIRESNYKPGNDYDAPRRFKDVLINVGLQLPLGLKAPPPPPEPVVEVVPVLPPADSDGDGVTDDLDQCPGTPTGAAIDSKGCELPPPCKSVPAGEHIVLGGCAAGDVLVLHGVTFEFDQARLTANAQVILDNVVEELKAYPTIQVELRGHTDSRGSDSYNQRLSEQRAQAVLDYLVESGIGSERVTAAGYGESEPVADNETDEGRELNRRVELKVTEGGVSVAGAAITEAAPPEEAADTAEPASFEMQ